MTHKSKIVRAAAAGLAALPLASCISVKTPEKPIEINLNVTIKQEVLVRLAGARLDGVAGRPGRRVPRLVLRRDHVAGPSNDRPASLPPAGRAIPPAWRLRYDRSHASSVKAPARTLLDVRRFRYKYTDLSTARIKDYTFDYDRILSFDGNTAPNLECAHVRIQSFFRKAGVKPQDATGPIVLDEPAERALAMTLLEFEGLPREFEQSLDFHRLCGYLYGLATAFTSFYEHCPSCVLRPTLAPAGWRCGSSPLRPGCAAITSTPPQLSGGKTRSTRHGNAPAGSCPVGCRPAPPRPKRPPLTWTGGARGTLEENDGARHNARHEGVEDRMVSANLPEPAPVTELNSLTRTAAYLIQRGAEATTAERDAYEVRKKELMAKLGQAVP